MAEKTSGPQRTASAFKNPLAAGEWVILLGPKHRRKLIRLEPGKNIFSASGKISCDDLIGCGEPRWLFNDRGKPFLVQRPSLGDFTVEMPRGPNIIHPRYCAQILGVADISPGQTVVEAGVGSGALTMWLLRALGCQPKRPPQAVADTVENIAENIAPLRAGQLISCEAREEFARIAEKNVVDYYGHRPELWQLQSGEVEAWLGQQHPGTVDRLLLDLLAPWQCAASAASALRSGGILLSYVATITQVSRLVETLRGFYVAGSQIFSEPLVQELLERRWHVRNLAIRPEHGAGRHGGFLVSSFRLAPDSSASAARQALPRHTIKHSVGEDDLPPWYPQQLGM